LQPENSINSELIVGPVFASEIEGILDFAGERDIPVISPMDPAAENTLVETDFFINSLLLQKSSKEHC
jgi:hypothetical protein